MTYDLEEITSDELSPACMRCMLDKYLDACPADTPWRTRAAWQRRVLRTVADGSLAMTAPEISDALAAALRDMFGIDRRDYSQDKHRFNQLVLGFEEQVRGRLERAADPLALAVRLALVGNFIDFGPTGDVSERKLLELIDGADGMRLDEASLAELEARIADARTIAYLTDNCGEVVLDKLLIERILAVNPQAQVLAIVRGAPCSNDATMEDAREVGLDALVSTIGNGSDVAGTVPSLVNGRTREALHSSDLVIAKGLANYETLSGRGRNVRYLFLCKCPLYQRVFNVPLHTGMIVMGV